MHTVNTTKTSSTTNSRYSLRRGLNAWELCFEGQTAVLRHEQGLIYVAYLLYHPGTDPLHGQELRLRAWHPATGGRAGLVQQRSAGMDEAEADRERFRKQCELEALVEDLSEPEPVRLEAQRELEALYEFQNRNLHHTRDNARRAAEAVRKAIYRLQRKLLRAVDERGHPHAVLRRFVRHLDEHLLGASSVHSRRRVGARTGNGSCFTYRPPAGVRWAG